MQPYSALYALQGSKWKPVVVHPDGTRVVSHDFQVFYPEDTRMHCEAHDCDYTFSVGAPVYLIPTQQTGMIRQMDAETLTVACTHSVWNLEFVTVSAFEIVPLILSTQGLSRYSFRNLKEILVNYGCKEMQVEGTTWLIPLQCNYAGPSFVPSYFQRLHEMRRQGEECRDYVATKLDPYTGFYFERLFSDYSATVTDLIQRTEALVRRGYTLADNCDGVGHPVQAKRLHEWCAERSSLVSELWSMLQHASFVKLPELFATEGLQYYLGTDTKPHRDDAQMIVARFSR